MNSLESRIYRKQALYSTKVGVRSTYTRPSPNPLVGLGVLSLLKDSYSWPQLVWGIGVVVVSF